MDLTKEESSSLGGKSQGPVCLIFGNESGLRRLTKETCDQILRILHHLILLSLTWQQVSKQCTKQKAESIESRNPQSVI